jgi:hypothetical protein
MESIPPGPTDPMIFVSATTRPKAQPDYMFSDSIAAYVRMYMQWKRV